MIYNKQRRSLIKTALYVGFVHCMNMESLVQADMKEMRSLVKLVFLHHPMFLETTQLVSGQRLIW